LKLQTFTELQTQLQSYTDNQKQHLTGCCSEAKVNWTCPHYYWK